MKSFNEIYEKIYKESFEELRREENKRLKGNVCVLIISIVIILLPFLLIDGTIDNFEWIMLYAIFIITITMIIIVIRNKLKYTPAFKEKAIKPFIKNVDQNLNYAPNQGIPSLIYRQGEFEAYDNYRTEDLIFGKLDGKYKLQMAEVHTEEETTDSEGNKSTYTLFHGMFGNVECAKNIGATFKIRSDKGKLGNLFKNKTKIEMDSQEFEKYFDVYGDNKIVAMQILTSEVMATMIEFIEQSKIKYELTIRNDQIYIRFHTGGVFEPNLFKSSLDYSMLKKYYDIIDFVFKVTREINKTVENTEI